MASSLVWDYFTKIENGSKAQCNDCELKLAIADGSTSSLRRHLQKRHCIDNLGNARRKRSAASTSGTGSSSNDKLCGEGQPTLKQFVKANQSLDKNSDRHTKITKSIAKMIFSDLQPFTLVEDTGFRQLIKTLEPRYLIPCRATFRKTIIPSMYTQVSEELRKVISQAPTYSITTDAWTSRNMDSFITYTMHVVDAQFVLNSFVIGTYKFDQQHTSHQLRVHLVKTFKQWGIINDECSSANAEDDGIETEDDDDSESLAILSEALLKKIVITTDNAANICKAIRDSKMQHVRCFAHTINLAVQKAVESLDSQISNVRKIVKYFHRSSAATMTLQVSNNVSYCAKMFQLDPISEWLDWSTN